MVEFSVNARSTKPSAIREIMKNMSDPSVISFAGGNPAAECFPVEEIRRYSDKILTEYPVKMLQYSITEGVPSLRESLRAFANRYVRIAGENDDLIVLTGSQQAMDLTARVYCDPGDVVVAEDPSFVGALQAFRNLGARTVGVPLQEDGVDLGRLEAAFAATPRPKFFYIIPNFQNPTGLVTSAAKRRAIYDLAVKYNVMILEDNPYGELRFEGDFIAPIKSYDTCGQVIYAGSFSKILAPGMRLAYLIADKSVIAKAAVLKQTADAHTNTWAQMVCDEWLRHSDVEKHIRTIAQVYARKCRLMLAEMDRCFDRRVTYTRPTGGMFLWVTLPDSVDVTAFVRAAQARKVAVVPGDAFLCDPAAHVPCLRMNYSAASDENIVKGVAILGELTRQFCG